MGGTSRGSRQRAARDGSSSGSLGSQAGSRGKAGSSSRASGRQRSAEQAVRTRISRGALTWRDVSHVTIGEFSKWVFNYLIFLHDLRYHISSLFENDRHFSHLSSLERELTFRTEMGLYYSYYKTIAEAPEFLSGLEQIMRDNLTEFPQVINTLERFNLYPEVLLSAWYRVYTAVNDAFDLSTTQCWTVKRGEGLDSVESCEGMGDLAYFYVNMVFVLNGVMMAVFYLYGAYLSGSQLGGVVTVACFFFNHGEGTRVMWTPPLRESFSYPFLILQMLLVTCVLRCPAPKMRILIMLVSATLFFMLPWQFSQFVMLVQAHIFNLLKSKLSNYQDFDTQLYSCAPEFDYLERKTLVRFSKTLLLPTVVIVILMISCKVSLKLLLFHTFTLIAFAAMAILIMRLKLFLTPHMCLMASLVCFRQVGKLNLICKIHTVVVALLGMMAWKGSQNLRAQWAILGEFSNLPQEELIEWIRDYTAPDAVFAGAMPTMASVKLSAERPIVNHPHYEDAGLRYARTKLVYMLYSRKNVEDVWRAVKKCAIVSTVLPGCSLPEIWDIEDTDNRGRVPVCTRLASNPEPYFLVEFQNYVYAVLRVKRSI
uniref:Dpy-19-like 1, like (H. sapiens) n=1 Tax=Eptatretus burgeri TaxID=7764 RepID=A0A8C4QA88_EPTBU